ncbi:TIGR02391 family protein [Sphingomonas lenta]|uniref:Conserved hypothetical protein CHP02391 domain-containing protein n=1 Tax=Sphingomonas lenta TaxID=1141887 RepID=A0A2A2SI15_9SPHN|nr:hypothetical protein CKY28_06115 [Sphingomonas lenta]
MSIRSYVTRQFRAYAWAVLVGERGNDTGQPRYIGGPTCDEAIGDLLALLGTCSRPLKAWIVSDLDTFGHGDHALLIETTDGAVVVRGGLTSGYNGQGARALASSIKLLVDRDCYPEDAVVRRDVLLRARHCALLDEDIELIRNGGDVRRRQHFTHYLDAPYFRERSTWEYGRPVLPLSLLHPSLRSTAQEFFVKPGQVLRDVARDIEHRVKTQLPKARSRGQREGAFWNNAFSEDNAPLVWPDLEKGEVIARVKLFEGAFGTIRNPRAHRPDVPDDHAFEELLLLNMLLSFVDEAEPRQMDGTSGTMENGVPPASEERTS